MSILAVCQVALTWSFPASPLEALNGAIVGRERLLLPGLGTAAQGPRARPSAAKAGSDGDPVLSRERITSVALFPFLRPN